ncbi:hypothetical protein ACFP2T_13470 [Plantactinospora solaniradicis]|uniref:Phage tail tape measure protein n=1 Tax=Plantactinospora solaniradicis TaxID=1723736 RepID=A0ABW1K7H5_9ACTN
MSDTSLVFNILAKDRASRVFSKVRRAALDGGSAIRMAFGPGAAPVLATATAGAIGLGAALAGAGAAAGVFGAVTASAFSEVQEASKKSADLVDKVALLEERIRVANATGVGDAKKLEKARVNALNELMARYNQMPPALRQVTQAYDGMGLSWQRFVDKNKPATYGIMTRGFTLISSIVPKLQPLFDVAANAAGRLVNSLTKAAGGGGIERLVGWLTAQAGPALTNLGTIGKNFAIVMGSLLGEFDSTGQGILKWIADASTKWAAWAQQTEGGGLQAFSAYVQQHGPQVFELLSNLATAAVNIAQATAPLAPISLAIAGALASIVAALPPGVITALVAAWISYSVAMKGYRVAATAAGIATSVASSKAVTALGGWMVAGARWSATMIASAGRATATWVASMARWVATSTVAAARSVATMAIAVATTVGGWIAMAASAMASAAVIAIAWLISLGPIALIVLGIIALIAIFVLLWNKCSWFRDFWIGAWNLIKGAVMAAFGWIRDNWKLVLAIITGPVGMAVFLVNKYWGQIKAGAGAAVDWVKTKWNQITSFFTGLRNKIAGTLSGMFSPLWSGFRNTINKLIGGWNRLSFTIGGGSFAGISIPSASFGTPNIPYLYGGGTIAKGGAAMVADKRGRGGEMVHLPKSAQVTPLRNGAGGGAVRVDMHIEPGAERFLHETIRKFVTFKGGSVQSAYGSGS